MCIRDSRGAGRGDPVPRPALGRLRAGEVARVSRDRVRGRCGLPGFWMSLSCRTFGARVRSGEHAVMPAASH
eukprot:15120224-Alexandrium_andersonii.AAC.1